MNEIENALLKTYPIWMTGLTIALYATIFRIINDGIIAGRLNFAISGFDWVTAALRRMPDWGITIESIIVAAIFVGIGFGSIRFLSRFLCDRYCG